MSFSHEESVKELETIISQMLPNNTNRSLKATIDKFINSVDINQVQKMNYLLPSQVINFATLDLIQCFHASIYIAGNYQKVTEPITFDYHNNPF